MKGRVHRCTLRLLTVFALLLPIPAVGQTLDFGPQTVGTTSAPKLLGGAPFVNRGIGVSTFRFEVTGDFRRGPGSTCGFTLGPGESCVFYVVFAPQRTGQRSGTVRYIQIGFTDTIYPLTGIGVAAPPPPPP